MPNCGAQTVHICSHLSRLNTRTNGRIDGIIEMDEMKKKMKEIWTMLFITRRTNQLCHGRLKLSDDEIICFKFNLGDMGAKKRRKHCRTHLNGIIVHMKHVFAHTIDKFHFVTVSLELISVRKKHCSSFIPASRLIGDAMPLHRI